jgi:hypothetical protein
VIVIASGQSQLPDYPIEGGSNALGTTNVVVLLRGIPIKFERPAFGAMRQEAAEREAHLHAVDAGISAFRNARAQNMDRQRDDDTLVTRQSASGQ